MKDIAFDYAFEIIYTLKFQDARLDAINKNLTELFGDISPTLSVMTEDMERLVTLLLDHILGEGLASYFLYECRRDGGMIREADGTEWKINTIDDLRKYATHIRYSVAKAP